MFEVGDKVVLSDIGREALIKQNALHYFENSLFPMDLIVSSGGFDGSLIILSPVYHTIYINLNAIAHWFNKIEQFEFEDVEAEIV